LAQQMQNSRLHPRSTRIPACFLKPL
jgi:hypothetical protein